MPRARVRNEDHASGGNCRTGPPRFIESRTSTERSPTATSTHAPLLDAALVRHAQRGSPVSATRLPFHWAPCRGDSSSACTCRGFSHAGARFTCIRPSRHAIPGKPDIRAAEVEWRSPARYMHS